MDNKPTLDLIQTINGLEKTITSQTVYIRINAVKFAPLHSLDEKFHKVWRHTYFCKVKISVYVRFKRFSLCLQLVDICLIASDYAITFLKTLLPL